MNNLHPKPSIVISSQIQNHPNKLARSPSLLQRVRSINFYGYKQEQQQPNVATKTVVTSDANHFGAPVESHNFFIFEGTHIPETLENPSQYMFQEPHKENDEFMHSQYDFEQTQDLSGEDLDDNTFIQSGSHHLNQKNAEGREEEEEEEKEGEEREYAEESDEVQSLEEVFNETSMVNISRTKSDTEPSGGEVTKKLPRKMMKSASLKSAFGHFQEEEIVETRRPATVREGGAEPDREVDAKADDFINKFKQQLKLQRVDSIARYKDMITRGSAK
ncbi:hypothetical protein Leryth_018308 [Lithospermum erythrorhizon]|nr:hypothetical protein Leryth_018308 [Lithospermum erythrorhizon]